MEETKKGDQKEFIQEINSKETLFRLMSLYKHCCHINSCHMHLSLMIILSRHFICSLLQFHKHPSSPSLPLNKISSKITFKIAKKKNSEMINIKWTSKTGLYAWIYQHDPVNLFLVVFLHSQVFLPFFPYILLY